MIMIVMVEHIIMTISLPGWICWALPIPPSRATAAADDDDEDDDDDQASKQASFYNP